jgi:hypothetical protein
MPPSTSRPATPSQGPPIPPPEESGLSRRPHRLQVAHTQPGAAIEIRSPHRSEPVAATMVNANYAPSEALVRLADGEKVRCRWAWIHRAYTDGDHR